MAAAPPEAEPIVIESFATRGSQDLRSSNCVACTMRHTIRLDYWPGYSFSNPFINGSFHFLFPFSLYPV